ncbi:SC6A7 protein, partial [Eubucco bourcierii]|nr:SC6A7 protein [Eubucco bourcierii]
SPPEEPWAGRSQLLLSTLSQLLGLGTLWRFPYLCYHNGGGVFLTPYVVLLLLLGAPLCLLQLSLGHCPPAAPLGAWHHWPLLKGIGMAMLVVASLLCLYTNVLVAWALFYLGSSFQCPLPWASAATGDMGTYQGCVLQNTSQRAAVLSASEAFWNQEVLGVTHSSGIGDPGPVRWPLALCLLAAWLLVLFCALKDIRASGKLLHFTATFPCLLSLILLIRGASLRGALGGVHFYLSSDWSRLQSAQVWSDAASQVFYSLGIGFGGLHSRASYRQRNPNLIRDTLVITLGSFCTTFLSGFVTFSVLGHMAWRKEVPVGSVVGSGPGLAFVVYPELLSLLPGSPFWAVLFFLLLLLLGVDTSLRTIDVITSYILEQFPALREWRRKLLLLAALCTSCCLLGLLQVTQGGIFWVSLLDRSSTGFGLLLVAICMCLGIAFCYGVTQFCQDISAMLCPCPPWCHHLLGYFRLCWAFLTPCTLLFTLIYTLLDFSNLSLTSGPSKEPAWASSLGVCIGLLTCLQVPLWATLALCHQSGSLS